MYSQILVHVLFLHRQSIQQCHQRIDFLRLNLTADLVNSCLQCLGGNFALFVHQFRNGRAIFGAFQQFIDLCLGIGNDYLGGIDSFGFFRKVSVDDDAFGDQLAIPAFHLIGDFSNSLTIHSLGLDHILIAQFPTGFITIVDQQIYIIRHDF